MKYRDQDDIACSAIVAGLCLFIGILCVAGCSAPQAQKDMEKEIGLCRMAIPRCTQIINEQEDELVQAKIQINLCNELNSALQESNDLLRKDPLHRVLRQKPAPVKKYTAPSYPEPI